MECPNPLCGGSLRVRHSYSAGKAKTQTLECSACLKVSTFIVAALNYDPAHGDGALALAKRLGAGEVRVSVVVEEAPPPGPAASSEAPG